MPIFSVLMNLAPFFHGFNSWMGDHHGRPGAVNLAPFFTDYTPGWATTRRCEPGFIRQLVPGWVTTKKDQVMRT